MTRRGKCWGSPESEGGCRKVPPCPLYHCPGTLTGHNSGMTATNAMTLHVVTTAVERRQGHDEDNEDNNTGIGEDNKGGGELTKMATG